MTYDSVYITIDGVDYKDYKLYVNDTSYNNGNPPTEYSAVVLDNKPMNSLCTMQSDQKVPKGSSIYCTPNLSIPINDVRNNYTIKRKPEDADYIIISRNGFKVVGQTYTYSMIAIPSKKYFIAYIDRTDLQKLIEAAKTIFPDLDTSEVVDLGTYSRWFSILAPIEAYKDILDGTTTKVIASESNLDLNTENELTVDTLQLLLAASKGKGTFENVEKDYIIQLKVLNQHNWREYPYTIYNVFNFMLKWGSDIDRYVRSHLSKYPKEIKNLYRSYKFVSDKDVKEKDFCLLQNLFMSILKIDSTIFASLVDVQNKLSANNIPVTAFNRLFNPIVKIAPVKYNATKEEN